MSTGEKNGEANPRLNSRGSCFASPTWNTAQMSMCGACDPCGSKGMSLCFCPAFRDLIIYYTEVFLTWPKLV